MRTLSSRAARIAVVDDDHHLRTMLQLGLAREGFDVRTAADGEGGLALVVEWEPDAIVLDVMMPRIDGIRLIPMVRRVSQAPILMLTAKGELTDRVDGLTAGADDYIVKPFFLEELAARIHAAVRRPHLSGETELCWGSLVLNVLRREVWQGDREVQLTGREFDLLAVLMREPLRVFSKDHLLDLVWGRDFEGQQSAVETYISYLRAKLDRGSRASMIRTVRGIGYALARERAQ
ncbi:MAG TPA: response regulator transcription factor [Candidatus Elarobacter sp.]